MAILVVGTVTAMTGASTTIVVITEGVVADHGVTMTHDRKTKIQTRLTIQIAK